MIETITKKKKCKNTKWLSEEALQIAEKRREVKGKGEKERYIHLNAQFQRIVRRDMKAFISDQCLEIEELYRVSKKRPGSDCGSDHELHLVKFRVELNKVRKTTRPFRYNLNQIPYDYTVEVTNRLKGLDLIERVPEELRTEVCDIVHEAVIKTIPKKKKCQKAKWLSEEALQIAVKRREAKGKGEKE